ncbi:YcaO-like family protein [Streptomyces sp. MAR4 CNX-425]|uniref:YcaO-like family protein n=1 Tax=Streptomyces sp. MAR4 CNX-425 TaxID=3406343 RepID=UPI003B513A46
MSGNITDTLESLEGLVSRYGVVSATKARPKGSSAHCAHRTVSQIGTGVAGRGLTTKYHTICGGASLHDADLARLVAIAEGAERYAGMVPVGDESIVASAAELGGDCLDPARYPRCSTAEYAHPACSVVPFDDTAEIRWVRGWDLIESRQLWVPAVMAAYAGTDMPAEKFAYQISTGYAVHTDPVEAAVRGICEVIERDAIAVLWLQRLPIPRLREDITTDAMADIVEWFERRFTRIHLFDATTDLGLPTVYAVAAADEDERACRYVSCGTGRSLAAAAESALLETAGGDALIHGEEPVTKLEEIRGSIGEASRYMAARERAHAFDFLTAAGRTSPREARDGLPESPDAALAVLKERLAAAGMQVAVVDRTTEELSGVGLTAMNVVIPDLQPMSTNPWVQFKGHGRLYSSPRLMGYRVLPEEELNPWPQPFA